MGDAKVEYRVWNPFRSKLAAAIVAGVENIYIRPGASVLYLGAASGTTVSHCSDVVGPSGVVYAVEFSHRSGRDLTNLAKRRPNVVPIVEDARYPLKYRMLLSMVDVIFADVAQPDQARIVGLNAQYFLKNDGHFVISIKANCIDSTVPAEAVFASGDQQAEGHEIQAAGVRHPRAVREGPRGGHRHVPLVQTTEGQTQHVTARAAATVSGVEATPTPLSYIQHTSCMRPPPLHADTIYRY